MISAEDFLNQINEKTWRNNIEEDVSVKLDQVIEYILEHKNDIIEEVSDDVRRIEDVKNEDKELFEYSDAQKWMIYYVKEAIKGIL